MLIISLNRSSHAGTIERTCVEKKPVEFVSCKAIVVDKPEDQMAEGVSPGAVGECRNRVGVGAGDAGGGSPGFRTLTE